MKTLHMFQIFVIFIFSIFSFNCSPSSKTSKKELSQDIISLSYIKSKYQSKYPESLYLLGVGIVESSGNPVKDQKLADYYAFSEIANQIMVNIKTDIRIQDIEILTDKSSEFQEFTTANIAVTSSVVISGLKIVDRFYDTKSKIYYSVAVLDRELALAPLKARLNELKMQYESYLRNYKNLYNKGRIMQALNDLKSAYSSAIAFNDLFHYYQVFRPIFNPYDDEFQLISIGDLISMASDLLSKISIVKIKGDNQEGVIGKPLHVPLEIKVILKDTTNIPAEGVPVRFSFIRGKGKIRQRVVTNDEGLASAIVESLERSETENFSIEAVLDFSSLLDTAGALPQWNNLFSSYQKSTIFTVRLKEFPGLKVLLIIDEEDKNNPVATQTLASELKRVGLNPITENDIGEINSLRVRRLLSQNDFERLQSEFISNFSIVIFGKYKVTYTSEYSGIYIANVVGSVKAISVEKSNLIAEESFTELRGFGNNIEQAKINALKTAGVRTAESIISQLIK